VDWALFWKGLEETNYAWLVPCLATLALAFLIRVERWRRLYSPATRPPFAPTTKALLVGYLLNNLLPARAGDAVRVFYLHNEAGTSRSESVGTVVTERIYDVLSLLLLLFVAAPFLPEVTWLKRADLLAAVLTAFVLMLAFVLWRYGERPVRRILRPLARLPGVSAEDTERAAERLTLGLAGLHRPRVALVALSLTTLSWIVVAVSTWFLLIGFDLGVGLGAAFLVLVTTGLALVLPSLPAGIGVYEAATLLALSAYGVDDSRALSFAVVLHGVNFFPYFLAVYFVVPRGMRRALRREAQSS
jgi:glycosyltransferase 2 family protein